MLSSTAGEGDKLGATSFGGREEEGNGGGNGNGDGGLPYEVGQLERRGSASPLGRMLDTANNVKRKRCISGNPAQKNVFKMNEKGQPASLKIGGN